MAGPGAVTMGDPFAMELGARVTAKELLSTTVALTVTDVAMSDSLTVPVKSAGRVVEDDALETDLTWLPSQNDPASSNKTTTAAAIAISQCFFIPYTVPFIQ